jgi:phage-related protein
MSKNFVRQVVYFKHYYLDFFRQQTEEVQKKFNFTLQLISELERVPAQYFKHIENTEGLYEIRVEAGGNIFRVFCFFDKGKLVILINGFQKKTQKTPKKEIELAEKLRKQYFNEKESD